MRVPPRELEVLWVTALTLDCLASHGCAQFIADVLHGVVVASDNTNTDNKVKVLPTGKVSRPICDVRLCGCEAAGVLI